VCRPRSAGRSPRRTGRSGRWARWPRGAPTSGCPTAQGVEDRGPRPHRRRAALGPAPRLRHDQALRRGPLRRLQAEPALADAGFAGDQERRAPPLLRPGARGFDAAQLVGPPHEPVAGLGTAHATSVRLGTGPVIGRPATPTAMALRALSRNTAPRPRRHADERSPCTTHDVARARRHPRHFSRQTTHHHTPPHHHHTTKGVQPMARHRTREGGEGRAPALEPREDPSNIGRFIAPRRAITFRRSSSATIWASTGPRPTGAVPPAELAEPDEHRRPLHSRELAGQPAAATSSTTGPRGLQPPAGARRLPDRER